MDETIYRKIAQEEIQKYMNVKQYTYSKVPSHEHNGVDTSRINIKNLVMGVNQCSGLVSYSANPAVENRENYTFNFSNPRQLIFHGYMANGSNGDGTVTGTTKRAIVNGTALFGTAENLSTLTPTPVTSIDSDGIIQGCSSMFIDASNIANTRVVQGTAYLAYAADSSSNVIGSVSCIAFTPSSITVEFYVNVGYVLAGTFLIS